MTIIGLPAPRPADTREETGDELAHALSDPDVRVRRAAAGALIDEREVLIGERGVRALVEAEQTCADGYVLAIAAELVRAMRAAAWQIYTEAVTRDDAARAETVRGLSVLRAATELAEIALTDPDLRVRERATSALGDLDSRAAIGPLTSALEDEAAAVRRAAVRALERWAADRHYARTALTTALDDPDPGVRAAARWALSGRRPQRGG